jgi:hypothetical protein
MFYHYLIPLIGFSAFARSSVSLNVFLDDGIWSWNPDEGDSDPNLLLDNGLWSLNPDEGLNSPLDDELWSLNPDEGLNSPLDDELWSLNSDESDPDPNLSVNDGLSVSSDWILADGSLTLGHVETEPSQDTPGDQDWWSLTYDPYLTEPIFDENVIATSDCSSTSDPLSKNRKRADQCESGDTVGPSVPTPSLPTWEDIEDMAQEAQEPKWCSTNGVLGLGVIPVCHTTTISALGGGFSEVGGYLYKCRCERDLVCFFHGNRGRPADGR